MVHDKNRRCGSTPTSPLLLGGIVVLLIVMMGMPVANVPTMSAYAEPPSIELPEGMTPEITTSIDRGLAYLANTQRHDGSWSSGGSYRQYSVVFTSLAGLSMLAGGSTPESGPYSRQVSKAMNYVMDQSQPSGVLASAGTSRSMYDHGFGMLFLAQCYGMELTEAKEEKLRDVLQRGVDLIAKSQSDLGSGLGNAGGWYYTPTDRMDEGSVTVTQLQALRACRNVGIAVPKETIDRAVAYLRYCQMADGGICYAAFSRHDSRAPISAAALACFYAAGYYDRQAGGGGEEAKMVERLWKYCENPSNGIVIVQNYGSTWGHYFYGHLYYSQAMYMRGGDKWLEYYEGLSASMISGQNLDGSWSGGVGTPYRTAIATLMLQLPYAYLPICQR
jgi:hypothetical protein